MEEAAQAERVEGGVDPFAVGGGSERERNAGVAEPGEQGFRAGQQFGVFAVGAHHLAVVGRGVPLVAAGERVAFAQVGPGAFEGGAEVAAVVGFAEVDAFVGEQAAHDLVVQRLAVDEHAVHIEDHCGPVARRHDQLCIASTPPVMSSSSEVICSWRALL